MLYRSRHSYMESDVNVTLSILLNHLATLLEISSRIGIFLIQFK